MASDHTQITLTDQLPTSVLDQLLFAPAVALAAPDWQAVPDTPGVYAIFDGDELIYVGMAGRDRKGSLRRRLRDHAGGQIVNMFAQYLLFHRILFDQTEPVRTPRDAQLRCRAYIRERCTVRFLALGDKGEAIRIEKMLRQTLRPTFNAAKL